jgi:hypothetical protein
MQQGEDAAPSQETSTWVDPASSGPSYDGHTSSERTGTANPVAFVTPYDLVSMEQLFLDFHAALQERSEGRMRFITTSLLRRRFTLAFLFAIWKRLERKDWQIYRDTKPGQTLLAYCREAFLLLDERDHPRKLMDDYKAQQSTCRVLR